MLLSFQNSFDSRTSGLDVVANYNNILLGEGKLGFNLSGNVTYKMKVSDVTNNFIRRNIRRIMFTSRPDTKWILGLIMKLVNLVSL
jgi:iron complex outermembrane receptor protein